MKKKQCKGVISPAKIHQCPFQMALYLVSKTNCSRFESTGHLAQWRTLCQKRGGRYLFQLKTCLILMFRTKLRVLINIRGGNRGKQIQTWKFIISNTDFALAFDTLAFASCVAVTCSPMFTLAQNWATSN